MYWGASLRPLLLTVLLPRRRHGMCDVVAWTHSTCSHLVSMATKTTAVSSFDVSQDVFSEGPHAYLENTGALSEAECRLRVPSRLRWATIAFSLLSSFFNSNQWVWFLPLWLITSKIKCSEVYGSVPFTNTSKGYICDICAAAARSKKTEQFSFWNKLQINVSRRLPLSQICSRNNDSLFERPLFVQKGAN